MNKELIRQAVDNFSHLLPRYQKCDNFTFAHLICENYSINNPKTKAIYDEISKDTGLYFIRYFNQVTIRKI